MKFTLSWLKEHLETDEPLEKLADKLTMIGLEVEHIEDKAKALAPYTIARVVSAVQHPNADRLRLCMVDTGETNDKGEPAHIQVVCGAPNARTGLVSVFAPPGTYIPGKNITLGIGNIRGVESRGMLCSAAELEISDDHDGIIELPDDAPIGKGYAEWAGLGDPVIEINLTPNRQDCTGVHGIARDLSAADMGKFKDPTIKPIKGDFPCPVKVTVEDASLCPGFALRLVRGVKNGSSPEWLQKRLTSIGLRPINALVDITNFMTYDRARPLHVFDAKKVHGHLTVRHAKDGETLLALDGRTYTLDPSICVIADDKGVESLAGIMGGEESGCDENTTDVLIESALWNEINIAQTGRKLGINSDARYRFERGVDPAFMVPGLELATRLDQETRQHQLEEQRRLALEHALAAPLAAGRVTLEHGRIGINGAVLFAFNSADLQPQGRDLLRSLAAPVAAYLKSRDEILMVSGFTDDRQVRGGSRQFADNWELSAQRALTVTRALVEDGVPPGAVFAAAFGAQQPVASNADAQGRARNRRVEMAPMARPARGQAASAPGG